MTMNTAIRTRDLTKTYDITVLDHVDLDVFEGQFVAIMGPSGSGNRPDSQWPAAPRGTPDA